MIKACLLDDQLCEWCDCIYRREKSCEGYMRVYSVLIASCFFSSAAIADENWVCNFPDTGNGIYAEHFLLHDKHFSEYVPRVIYDVLLNDQRAIVAVQVIGPGYSKAVPLNIQTDTLAIDRATGDAIKGYVSVYDTRHAAPVHGTCRSEPAPPQNLN
jgi:hypothetical protein